MADLTTMDGNFKARYAPMLSEAIPEYSVIKERVKFSERQRIGASYNFPVRLQRAHGVTWAGGSTADTAFALNSPVAGLMKPASLDGAMCLIRENVAYRAVTSSQGSENAFADAFDDAVKDAFNTISMHLELALLYGGTDVTALTVQGDGSGLGELASDATGAYTAGTMVLTAASSSLGLWSQLEGAKLDAYAKGDSVKSTANGAIVVTGVDLNSSGQVTISFTCHTSDFANIDSGDILVPYGAGSNWFYGIDQICRNSGSMFGISAATYPLWKANSYSAGSAALTFSKLTKAAALVAQRSNPGKMLTAMVSIPTWSDLNNNTAALRRLNENKSRVELGAESIVYHSAAGPLEIIAHPFCKQGEAFILDFDDLERVGSSDISFTMPGQPDKFLMQLADSAGFQFRCLFDQSVISKRPRGMCKVTGIVNDA